MSEHVKYSTYDGVGIVTIDNPPVNAVGPGVPEEIADALAAAASDPSVRAVVMIGAGRTFMAGADITRIGKPGGAPNIHLSLAKCENLPKPLVAAIHGAALGGGLEIAMACHYRVAAPDAQLGQPEVNLGIIPGAEGTQRLPRLAGVARAIEMCVTGAPVKAADALAAGIVDRIVEGDLLTGAVAFALEMADRGGPWPKASERRDKLGSPESNAELFAAGRDLAAKIRRNQTAPLKALGALEAATMADFAQASGLERALFRECVEGPQSQAMIHAFLAEREVSKVPGVEKRVDIPAIAEAGIIGAGTMGSGIAMAFANAGIPVRLLDADQAALDRGLANIRKNYENSVKKGRFSAAVMDQHIALIRPQLEWDGLESADVIIEAVFEDLALKKSIFREIDRVAKPSCVLASNTSSLDIDLLAAQTKRPHRMLGLHFFSPANVMRLLEIVRGNATAPDVLAASLAIARKLKKVGVVVGNCPGFVGNRMLMPYMREAQFLVEEGATPWAVDRALYDWGMAMGVFAVDDMAGIDVGWRIKQQNKAFQNPGARTPLVMDKLYEMGRYGQKTGAGWFRYDANRKPSPDAEVEALIESTARAAGIERRAIDGAEIVERCIYALVNEGARILEEGYALRASDIDTIYLTGYGFPVYRGGPMWYADTVGLAEVHRRVAEFHRKHGQLWTPAPLLARLASDGGTFAAWDGSRAAAAQ
ncbi:MAG TPA: 3-hydroxyacyl-CoA dehydrogenase NAD-binding domain-containing protein [Bryobacteraceae bacterium]|nr:3-hydroxyacyl-CoA dehydrogenase NAD-binding domain-containing protein [Bryobacteraceae bacterium]